MTDSPVSHDPGLCQKVSSVISRVGDRWSMIVLAQLGDGPRRFSEVKRGADGISQRMLTLTLRSLERDGLVKRTLFPAVPPRVEYALTGLGQSMLASLRALGNWTVVHLDEIEAARSDFDQRGAEHAGETDAAVPYVSRVHRMQ